MSLTTQDVVPTAAELARHMAGRRRLPNKKGAKGDSSDLPVARILRNLDGKLAIFSRRIAVRVSVSTDGTGRVPITTLASSAAVSALTDFTKCAGLYLAYRVKCMRTTLNPVFQANVAGIAPSPATLVTFFFTSGVAAANYQDAIDSSGYRQHSGYSLKIVAQADWKGQPDAQLWTPTTAAVTAAESYGIAIVEDTSATVSQLSTLYYTGVTEYDVEFMAAA